MAQTNASDYGFSMNAAQAGQKAGLDFDHVESFAAEGVVAFGHGVIFGTDPAKQVAVPADATGAFAGIAVFTHAQEQGIDQSANMGAQYSTGAQYRDGDTVSMLRRGRIYAPVSEDVAAGDTAYLDATLEPGDFTYEVNVSVTTFDADFVASNEIDLDVNGNSISTVTFDTDQETTFAALVSAVETAIGNNITSRYNVVGDPDARTLTISADAAIAVTSVAVTSGTSQAGSSVDETDNYQAGVFRTSGDAGGLAVVEINLP